MEENEKKIRQEDCNEDKLGPGILTLTNKRIAFDKTRSRIMDFSKNIGDTILDVPLHNVTDTWKEGLFMKKVCFTARTTNGEETYKFGVFGPGSWRNTIKDAIDEYDKDRSHNTEQKSQQ